MLSTNRQDYIKDLEEVVFMFSTGSDLDISHEQKTADETSRHFDGAYPRKRAPRKIFAVMFGQNFV